MKQYFAEQIAKTVEAGLSGLTPEQLFEMNERRAKASSPLISEDRLGHVKYYFIVRDATGSILEIMNIWDDEFDTLIGKFEFVEYATGGQMPILKEIPLQ